MLHALGLRVFHLEFGDATATGNPGNLWFGVVFGKAIFTNCEKTMPLVFKYPTNNRLFGLRKKNPKDFFG